MSFGAETATTLTGAPLTAFPLATPTEKPILSPPLGFASEAESVAVGLVAAASQSHPLFGHCTGSDCGSRYTNAWPLHVDFQQEPMTIVFPYPPIAAEAAPSPPVSISGLFSCVACFQTPPSNTNTNAPLPSKPSAVTMVSPASSIATMFP